jgi:hypothetical protein
MNAREYRGSTGILPVLPIGMLPVEPKALPELSP